VEERGGYVLGRRHWRRFSISASVAAAWRLPEAASLKSRAIPLVGAPCRESGLRGFGAWRAQRLLDLGQHGLELPPRAPFLAIYRAWDYRARPDRSPYFWTRTASLFFSLATSSENGAPVPTRAGCRGPRSAALNDFTINDDDDASANPPRLPAYLLYASPTSIPRYTLTRSTLCLTHEFLYRSVYQSRSLFTLPLASGKLTVVIALHTKL
jgi:hypothetical protein